MVIVIVVIAAIAGGGSSDDVDEDAEAGVSDVADGALGTSDAAGDGGEVDDVVACTMPDSDTVILDLTNNSSDQSSYIVDVNYLDVAGQRVADETFFVNFVRPGERAQEATSALGSAGSTSCEVAEVDRISAESPDPVAEVTCELAGVDVIGDVATSFTATNGSSELSDYFVTAALTRDSVRQGTATAVVENVPPGQAAPGEGFSIVDGPAEGMSCDVVHVERTSSER